MIKIKKAISCSKINYDIYNNDDRWKNISPVIKKFYKADNSGISDYNTALKICYNKKNIYIKFICNDTNVLSEYERYGDPVYNQEAVEVFLAPNTRNKYYEIDLSPKNVVYDALIKNNLQGTQFKNDYSWSCKNLRTKVIREELNKDTFGNWEAIFSIPFESLNTKKPEKKSNWYANFYRIKRIPKEEFSCWHPTKTVPPNFHIPKYFGSIIFD